MRGAVSGDLQGDAVGGICVMPLVGFVSMRYKKEQTTGYFYIVDIRKAMGGHGRPWEAMGGHGRPWEAMGGTQGFPPNFLYFDFL
jgi:hypothetical protein